jgi:glycosyltransferase involved in cell wall biosynthesis
MQIGVIITTYNQPVWLEKVLWGYIAQSTRDFQIIIADDGSEMPTREVIHRAKRDLGSRIKHVWHEDTGFRKCEILNKAILAAEADYLIFTDGDCIPRNDFVARHRELAEPDRFLSGGVVWLNKQVSDAITRENIKSGRFATPKWLHEHGWEGGRRRMRLVREPLVAATLDVLTPTGATFNGHNASVWKEALLAVNGFDAEMGYGGLDRALGERLTNHGLKGKQIRHRAVCFHLDHDRPYRKPEIVQRNREIRARIRRTGETRALRGIKELPPERDNA